MISLRAYSFIFMIDCKSSRGKLMDFKSRPFIVKPILCWKEAGCQNMTPLHAYSFISMIDYKSPRGKLIDFKSTGCIPLGTINIVNRTIYVPKMRSTLHALKSKQPLECPFKRSNIPSNAHQDHMHVEKSKLICEAINQIETNFSIWGRKRETEKKLQGPRIGPLFRNSHSKHFS